MKRADLGAIERRIGSLKISKSDDVLLLHPLTGNISLVRKKSGRPAITIQLNEEAVVDQNRVLEGLEVQIHSEAEVSVRGRRHTCPLAVIEAKDESRVRPFSLMCLDVFRLVQHDSERFRTAADVLAYIDEWMELFAPVRSLSLQEQIGLWGELEILAKCQNVGQAIRSWHGPDSKIFDFSTRGLHLEVKTSTGSEPHSFRLEQLIAPGRARVQIASLAVREDLASGESLKDQVMRVRRRLRDVLEFEKKLARMGYSDQHAYSVQLSVVELRLLNGAAIPRPRKIDAGVHHVIFQSDTSCVAAEPSARLALVLKMLSTG